VRRFEAGAHLDPVSTLSHSMQDQPQPSSENNLDSAEYRERLRRKLNCLIAVLEVATAKVKQSLAGPAPDVERLTRIQKNLQDTMDVCMRARNALDKRGSLPSGLSADLAKAVNPDLILHAPSEARARREFSSHETQKFARLPKIDSGMIKMCDLDELSRMLQA
jgi:hypothetical protein